MCFLFLFILCVPLVLILSTRMAYIEENLRIQRQQQDALETSSRDPNDEFSLSERWKTEKRTADEGSVTNSLAMLTAIPEVDLGMECVAPCFLTSTLTNDTRRSCFFWVAHDSGTLRKRRRRSVKSPKNARSAKR